MHISPLLEHRAVFSAQLLLTLCQVTLEFFSFTPILPVTQWCTSILVVLPLFFSYLLLTPSLVSFRLILRLARTQNEADKHHSIKAFTTKLQLMEKVSTTTRNESHCSPLPWNLGDGVGNSNIDLWCHTPRWSCNTVNNFKTSLVLFSGSYSNLRITMILLNFI